MPTPVAERWSSRKFATMVFFELVFVALFLNGTLSEQGFIILTTLTIGGYFAGNVAQKFAERVGK